MMIGCGSSETLCLSPPLLSTTDWTPLAGRASSLPAPWRPTSDVMVACRMSAASHTLSVICSCRDARRSPLYRSSRRLVPSRVVASRIRRCRPTTPPQSSLQPRALDGMRSPAGAMPVGPAALSDSASSCVLHGSTFLFVTASSAPDADTSVSPPTWSVVSEEPRSRTEPLRPSWRSEE